jgi:glutathione S-transferase
MKVYGIDVSSPTNKVRYTAELVGLAYEFVHLMPFSDDATSAEYRAKHPAGKVPVLEDGEFVMFESNAICKYLARKTGSDLYPAALAAQARVDQWMDFAAIHIGTAMNRVFWNTIGVKFMNQEPDKRSLADGRAFLGRFLPAADAAIGDSYLVDDSLTLADISLLSVLDPAEPAGVDLAVYANLSRWRAALQQQPFYQVDRSFGEKLIADLLAQ